MVETPPLVREYLPLRGAAAICARTFFSFLFCPDRQSSSLIRHTSECDISLIACTWMFGWAMVAVIPRKVRADTRQVKIETKPLCRRAFNVCYDKAITFRINHLPNNRAPYPKNRRTFSLVCCNIVHGIRRLYGIVHWVYTVAL